MSFNLDGMKVHQTLPGAGWRVLHTALEDFDVTDDAVIAFVTFKEIDCGSGTTWIGPLLKDGMLLDQYEDEDYEYVDEYLRPDATSDDITTALANLHVKWQTRRTKPSTTSAKDDLSKGVKRG